jgi:hypothetical protein
MEATMTDDISWVAIKEEWPIVVGIEIRQLTPVRVAGALVTHFNSHSHRAWMAPALLAVQLHMDRRNVQNALKALVAAGMIEREGRHYSIPDAVMTRIATRIAERRAASRGTQTTRHTGAPGASPGTQQVRPRGYKSASPGTHNNRISKNDQREGAASQPRALRRALSKPRQSFEFKQQTSPAKHKTAPAKHKTTPAQRNSGGAAPPRRRAAVPLPDNWVLGSEEIEVAQRIAGWDLDTTQDQFNRFKSWHKKHGKRYVDWFATWECWCVTGRDHDKEQARKHRPEGVESAYAGAQEWLRQQNDRKP